MVAVKEQVPGGVDLAVSDFSGQHTLTVTDFPADATVGELVSGMVREMGLNATNPQGVPYVFHARHERLGRHLHAAERIGEVFEDTGERVTLAPEINAGGHTCK